MRMEGKLLQNKKQYCYEKLERKANENKGTPNTRRKTLTLFNRTAINILSRARAQRAVSITAVFSLKHSLVALWNDGVVGDLWLDCTLRCAVLMSFEGKIRKR